MYGLQLSSHYKLSGTHVRLLGGWVILAMAVSELSVLSVPNTAPDNAVGIQNSKHDHCCYHHHRLRTLHLMGEGGVYLRFGEVCLHQSTKVTSFAHTLCPSFPFLALPPNPDNNLNVENHSQ